MNELNKLIEQSKLSQPFTKDDVGYIYDSNMVVVAQTRGWGHFQYLPNAEKLQDEFAQFIVDAMNEKLVPRSNCTPTERAFLDELKRKGYFESSEEDGYAAIFFNLGKEESGSHSVLDQDEWEVNLEDLLNER